MCPKKIILSGGHVERSADGGRAFCESVVGGITDRGTIKILECLFARDEDGRESAAAKDADFFRGLVLGVGLEFAVAEEGRFVAQVGESDIVYFRGGDTQRLLDTLRTIDGWESALGDKVVAGASAGAYALSELYVPLAISPPEFRKGLGLLPIKTVAHYRSDREDFDAFWGGVDELMGKSDGALIEVKLKEGEFIELRPDILKRRG